MVKSIGLTMCCSNPACWDAMRSSSRPYPLSASVARGRRVAPEAARDLVPVHSRQPDVQEDEVRIERAGGFQSGRPVVRDAHLVAEHLDQIG